jgi:hypothetical protein
MLSADAVLQKKTSLFYIKRTLGLILLLATAAVFFFSGISKLYSFESFTWNVMDAGVTNMTLAAILARLFIGFELLLGIFLLGHLYLKSFTYPAVIAILVLFTVYLFRLIVIQGNAGNCGCFGEAYEMSPGTAIIKNLIMIGVTIVLIFIYPIRPYKNSEWIAAFAGMTALVLPFIFYPMSGDAKPQTVKEPINLNPLYSSISPQNHPPSVELRTGKHIVAFMSLTCPHCKKAAFLLQVIHRQHPDLPIYMVLNGHPDFLQDFFKETHAQSIPHTLFRGGEEFQTMSGPGVPAIYWINNSVIEKKSNYFQLDPKYMEHWVKEN